MATADPIAPPDLTPPERPDRLYQVDQAAVFARLRRRLAVNTLRVMAETGRVRLATMVFTSLFVGLFVLALSWFGFREMFKLNVPVKGLIVGGLFDLMFFTLGGMLVFSTGVILYASLFTAPEARFLLATPATADQIFAAKFRAAVGFSSWAFLILGVPILVSYGLVAGVPWYFYPLLPAALVGFVLLPGSASGLGCLLFVRYFPRNQRQAAVAVGLAAAAAAGVWGVKVRAAALDSLKSGRRNDLDVLIAQFAATQHPLAPSHWMTEAVMAAAQDRPADALLRVAMLWSNGLVAYLAAGWAAGRVYRTGYDRIAGAGRGDRVYRGNLLDDLMAASVWYLARPTRILIVKDFRTFRRDPTQWVLIVVFAGLLVLGGMNFRRYYRADLAAIDRYIVSLVNVAGTAVLLCAGLSRFIFPLISLEGRKFWVLGLLPVSRRQILVGKFAFAATGASAVAVALIVASDLLLRLPWHAVAVHALTGLAVAVGLSGLNVGLGAYMPNFRETDPSKIVVGFGGTVNMVVGLGFLVVVVAAMSGPLYAAELVRRVRGQPLGQLPPWQALLGLPVGLLAAAAAVYLPLRAGVKSLQRTEF